MGKFILPSNFFLSNNTENEDLFYHKNKNISFQNFCKMVANFLHKLKTVPYQTFGIYSLNTLSFSVGFFALLLLRKTIVILSNTQKETIKTLEKTVDAFLFLEKINTLLPQIIIEENAADIAENDFNFLTSISDKSEIIFYTSGSTGEPKAIKKSLYNLEKEIQELHRMWGKNIKNNAYISTVSHQHIYGFLFRFLWPLAEKNAIHTDPISTPEQLIKLCCYFKNCILISSPAFISRISKYSDMYSFSVFPNLIFSSGSALAYDTAQKTKKLMKSVPIEILGSTETGGIAYRTQNNDDWWTPFSSLQLKVNSNGELMLKSPYIYNSKTYYTTNDIIEFGARKKFQLKGRSDRIIKTEEKRISLVEIELSLLKHPYVLEAYTLLLETDRREIGAIIKLTPKGEKYFSAEGKRNLNLLLKKYLLNYIELITVPRKWRYVSEIPINTQGKYVNKTIQKLFIKKTCTRKSLL